MIFTETRLKGAYVIEPEKRCDDRGFFARSWCEKEFADHNLNPRTVQCNISFNTRKGHSAGHALSSRPIRRSKTRALHSGLHIRRDRRSASGFADLQTIVAETLTAGNYKMLYVPEGFAHGFLTLEDNSEIFYQMSEFYSPQHSRGVRWNDPAFGIEWPIRDPIMADRDRNYPDFSA